jgi:peptidoglycan/LPS O-acetylase OafA/YrhL
MTTSQFAPARTSSQSDRRRRPLRALTGARFLAALGVVLFHVNFLFAAVDGASAAERAFGASGLLTTVVDQVAGLGSLGVNFFFLLSGYILAYNYLRSDGMATSARSFYLARFARIYPIYLVGLVLAFGYRLFIGSPCAESVCRAGDRPGVATASLVLLQGWLPWTGDAFNGPGWTLSAEAFFYTCFPVLVALVVRIRRRGGLLAVLLGGLICTQLGPLVLVIGSAPDDQAGPLAILAQFSPIVRLPEFVAGVAAWAWVDRYGLPRWLTGWRADPVLVIGGVLLLSSGEVLLRVGIDPIMVNDGLLDPVFLAMILALSSGDGVASSTLSSGIGQVMGESSYALYVLHWPCWFWFSSLVADGRQPMGVGPVLAYVVLMLGVALLAWRLLERPARRRLLRSSQPHGLVTSTPALSCLPTS